MATRQIELYESCTRRVDDSVSDIIYDELEDASRLIAFVLVL